MKILSSFFAGFFGILVSTHTVGSEVFVVHGINGDDLGLHEALPVDISVNKACSLTGVTYQTISDAIPLDPGQYNLEVRLADADHPCTGALAIVGTVNIQFGENAAIVAHLTEEGTPTLTKFVNDLRAIGTHQARVVVRHTAAAPPVAVSLSRGGDSAVLEDIRNAEQRAAEVPSDRWHVTIKPFGVPKVGPLPLELEALSTNIVYAVGSLKNGTFAPLIQVLPTLY